MRSAFNVLTAVLTGFSVAHGQGADSALKDRVARLVEKLGDAKVDARDAAQASLTKLGARVLPLLPDPGKGASPDLKTRLAKVREALANKADESNSFEASRVTIQGGGIRLSEALKRLQTQSGNPITDRREDEGQDATNPAMDLDIKDLPFFEALDLIAAKAGITPSYYTGDGSIGLMPGPATRLPDEIGAEAVKPLVAYSGPFRIAFRQILIQRDLQTGGSTANAQFEVAWEPRLRPMLLSLKADDVAITDDQGGEVLPAVSDESGSVVLRHENPIIEMNVNMDAPSRKAETLARFQIKADVTVPAALRTFTFPSLDRKDLTKQQGDVAVTLEGTDVEENAWKVRVLVELGGKTPVFETFQQGLFNNRVWLLAADGTRFEHTGDHGGGFNQFADGEGKLGFEYLFVDMPGKVANYQLIYETPGKVAVIPLEFEFKNVPLP
ncbi:MAG: hypothetical protein ABI353_05630 [Isosphaeraceae bacterium]